MAHITDDLPSSLRNSKPATRSPVAVCTYDNPTTWARECWKDDTEQCAVFEARDAGTESKKTLPLDITP